MWQDGCRALKSMRSGQWAWIRALNPRPLHHEPAHTNKPVHQTHTRIQIYANNKLPVIIPVKSWMLTPGYPLVLRWHHSSSASFAYFFPLLFLSSSCQHTQYVYCHDIRNRTTEYARARTHTHARARARAHTPLEVSAFAKPPTYEYTLNPNSKTSELAHFENEWRSPNRLLYASVGTARISKG